MATPPFFFHPGAFDYDFGPKHPLKPERLHRTLDLLKAVGWDRFDDAPLGRREDLERVHAPDYIHAVDLIGSGDHVPGGYLERYGFGNMDNPPFHGMYEAALGYVGPVVEAAKAVRDGEPLAFAISGGLHHAHRAKASGFCVFDDPAIACHILRERFDRVAYVDIDVHHGDGVQFLFYDDPTILTCSIHENPKTLFPGTGYVEEVGEGHGALNVPVRAKSTGDVWLWAFENAVLPALRRFEPGAIVLQCGTDTHFQDPLGHLLVTAQEWLAAARGVRDLGVPLVVVGGGGYNLTTVPRMWTALVLALSGREVPSAVPSELAAEWEMPRFFDEYEPAPRDAGREDAEAVVAWLREHHRWVAP